MRGCMISPGDRILRACNNCRANANAWLVALHQLVLNSEVAHSAARGLALGQKPKIARLGLFYPRAFNIRLCRTSRVHISRSTIGFREDTTCHTLLMGESLPPGYCPCCFVLNALYLLFLAPFFSSGIPLFKRINSVYQVSKGGHASVPHLLMASSALIMVDDVC